MQGGSFVQPADDEFPRKAQPSTRTGSSQDGLETLFSARYEDRDGVRYLSVAGEVDLAVKDEFALALDAPQIRIDLTEVTFVDSQGLGCLIEAKARLQEGMVVTGVSSNVERLLEIAGLDGELIDIG